jgi:hypothetical protein
MLPDLPKDYYLDNVVTLFEHVERLYADILPRQHCDFLQIFAGLPIDAKKLYVRLLNRSHDLFRQGTNGIKAAGLAWFSYYQARGPNGRIDSFVQ